MCCIHSSCLVCCIILLLCHNSYVRRVVQYRCGMIPSLHSDYFYNYRKSVDLVRLCTCYDCMFMYSLLKFNFTSLFNAGLYKCGECPLRHVWCCSLVLLLGWAHNHALCVAVQRKDLWYVRSQNYDYISDSFVSHLQIIIITPSRL